MQDIFKQVKWIQTDLAKECEDVVLYKKSFSFAKKIKKAELYITACGGYCAFVNGVRVSEPMAPGCDSYPYRMPYQIYDIGKHLSERNELGVFVSRGWYGRYKKEKMLTESQKRSLKAAIFIRYDDGSEEQIQTDADWTVCLGNCVTSDIYNGEYYDASHRESEAQKASETVLEVNERLLLSDGESVCEQERLRPVACFTTPKGEYVIDFGQNLTGYVEISVNACEGDVIEISHAEELDKDGNFYTENYRKAQAKLTYICKDGEQIYKPLLTYYGFRYIRLDRKIAGMSEKNFTAIAVYSNLKRTGYFTSSNPRLNKFFENVIWGQKDNFLHIPTDCPQRDERLGWTGDTQVFCRAAAYNFDCEKFYVNWLRMLKCEQTAYGYTPNIVPDVYGWKGFSSAWADAATIVPWEVYQAYGNKRFLAEMFPVMKRHVDGITESTTTQYLWTGGDQMGDWLALDSPVGSLQGGSDRDFIASAFYAHSVFLTIRAGTELGYDMSVYEKLYSNIQRRFKEVYSVPDTQTECVLALMFDLTDDRKKIAERLAEKLLACGRHLQTGFVGTPYLLHALSQNGYKELSYELLLREEFPSWLYSVKCGATTVWEHWDGKNEKGEFWSSDMNSFNHYAYGAVADWIYGVAAGITPLAPGFKKIKIAPLTTEQLDWLEVHLQTREGLVCVRWQHENGGIKYNIQTPTDALIIIDGIMHDVPKGTYVYDKN